MKKFVFVMAALLPLAACQTESDSGGGGGNMGTVSSSPIPDVGFDSSVSSAAVESCRRALQAETLSVPDVVGTEFSQANSTVYMTVGAQRAPWRCLVSNNGRGPELMFLGSEGAA